MHDICHQTRRRSRCRTCFQKTHPDCCRDCFQNSQPDCCRDCFQNSRRNRCRTARVVAGLALLVGLAAFDRIARAGQPTGGTAGARVSSETAVLAVTGGPVIDSLITVPAVPPDRIEIAMLFLAFDGSVRSQQIGRPRLEADSLARVLLVVARGGADFDSLITARSDQPRARPLKLVNRGFKPAPGEGRRSQLEPGVAALAFGMSPGDIGLVVPDNTTCKYGYYLVQRRQ